MLHESAPSYSDLTPLLLSGHYAHSLVIVATDQPPEVPHIVIPALRILHLSSPLTTENADAMRFVSILGWAERVAHDWRKYGGSGILELSEEDEFHPPNDSVGTCGHGANRLSSASHGSAASQTHRLSTAQAGNKRPFDALINFLPGQISDNVLLRQTILITSLSRPFLNVSASGSSLYDEVYQKLRAVFGSLRVTRSGRRASTDLPRTHVEALFSSRPSAARPLGSTARPHLIHLLPRSSAQYPQASMKTVESMETFLSAFTFAVTLDAGTDSRSADTLNNVRPYIMYSSTFGTALDCALSYPGSDTGHQNDAWGCEWTVADVVLSGALDGATNMPGSPVEGPSWVSGSEDIVLVPSSGHIPASALAIPRRVSAYHIAPVRIDGETHNAIHARAEKERPKSKASSFTTSYGHSLVDFPPPSFHDESAQVREEVPVDPAPKEPVPPETEEAPKTSDLPAIVEDLKGLPGNLIPRRASVKKDRPLMSGWRHGGAWRFGGKGKEALKTTSA